MSFPSPSVTPPTFSQWPSVQFQGSQGTITLGPAPFFLRGDGNFDGIYMPNVRNGDTAAPRVPGGYIGLDLLDMRDINLVIDVGPPFGAYTNLAGAMAALRSALTPSQSTENPLFFQLSSGGTMFATLVRPRTRGGSVDLAYAVGQLAQKIPIQFHATDPTLYAAGTLDPSVGVPAPLSGFSFPLTFNLSFGGGSEFGSITATNYGDLNCYPLIVFTGPCTYPALANESLPNAPSLQFQVSMQTGDQLFVNTDPKYPSAVYYASGSNSGSSVLYTLTQASNWWALQPGVNNLQFTTQDVISVAGTCTVEYSSAYSAAS